EARSSLGALEEVEGLVPIVTGFVPFADFAKELRVQRRELERAVEQRLRFVGSIEIDEGEALEEDCFRPFRAKNDGVLALLRADRRISERFGGRVGGINPALVATVCLVLGGDDAVEDLD